MRSRPCRAARITDSGLPPTATQVVNGAFSAGGKDLHSAQRLGEAAFPRDLALSAELDEHRELLLEQLLVVREVEAEQREGLGERPAAHDDLGAAVGQRVERGEALEDAYGIV